MSRKCEQGVKYDNAIITYPRAAQIIFCKILKEKNKQAAYTADRIIHTSCGGPHFMWGFHEAPPHSLSLLSEPEIIWL